ncbi:hypothetical protein FRX31_028858 [Thalictrum thalictroides]|uniref:rRNA N-glycosylase n=1 Tax=Thalictrum thalictroides TaxID=46969 RepID=A0A7J6VBK4_THATH|nr:hypothetical protein FRX31_028858 [Thalictrum thalictroides]
MSSKKKHKNVDKNRTSCNVKKQKLDNEDVIYKKLDFSSTVSVDLDVVEDWYKFLEVIDNIRRTVVANFDINSLLLPPADLAPDPLFIKFKSSKSKTEIWLYVRRYDLYIITFTDDITGTWYEFSPSSDVTKLEGVKKKTSLRFHYTYSRYHKRN